MTEINWESVCEHYGPLVWRTAYRLLCNDEETSDCFQEVFMAAVNYTKGAPVRSWPAFLRRLATARSLDILRKRFVRREQYVDAEQLVGMLAVTDDPSDRARDAEFVEAVRMALSRLPELQGVATTLMLVEGLSYWQIAKHLGKNVIAVRALVHRGRENLRLMLNDWRPSHIERCHHA